MAESRNLGPLCELLESLRDAAIQGSFKSSNVSTLLTKAHPVGRQYLGASLFFVETRKTRRFSFWFPFQSPNKRGTLRKDPRSL